MNVAKKAYPKGTFNELPTPASYFRSMKKIILAACCALMATACQYPDEFTPIEYKGLYTIDIPPYLKKTDAIHESAGFQYRNRYRNVYLIIIDDTVTTEQVPFDEYREQAIKIITDFAEDEKVEAPVEYELNGSHASETVLVGLVDEEPTFYRHLTISGKNHYYQLCYWTKADRRESFDEDFKKSIATFREL